MFNPDYWEHEPSEADEMIESIRQALKDSVSEEITKKINFLETENRKMQEQLSNLDTLTRDADRLKIEYERKLERLKSEAKREVQGLRAAEIFAEMGEIKWGLVNKLVTLPKCDNCDENRNLEFTNPRTDKVMRSNCPCTQSYYKYEEAIIRVHKAYGYKHGVDIQCYYSLDLNEDRYQDFTFDSKRITDADEMADEEIIDSSNPQKLAFSDEEKAKEVAALLTAKSKSGAEERASKGTEGYGW